MQVLPPGQKGQQQNRHHRGQQAKGEDAGDPADHGAIPDSAGTRPHSD